MQKDTVLEQLLSCKGDAKNILATLNRMNLKNVDFTLDEIGKILNISKERVRQIEKTALKKIKHPKNARLLLDYIK